MATTQITEECPRCGQSTPHEVRLEIREENRPTTTENVRFAREPYRITTCQVCGGVEDQRMNAV